MTTREISCGIHYELIGVNSTDLIRSNRNYKEKSKQASIVTLLPCAKHKHTSQLISKIERENYA